MSNSYKPVVQVIGGAGMWHENGLRFATHQEALDNARNLSQRWMLVTAFDAHESDDAPNQGVKIDA